MNITVTGGTGFIGRRLAEHLVKQGHTVHLLGRTLRSGLPAHLRFSLWDAARSEPPLDALSESDAVIHLAGESIGQRWSQDIKRRIRSSRIDGTQGLVSALAKLSKPPAILLSASAVGYYGSRGEEVLTEDSAAGEDWLAQMVSEWEQSAGQAASLGIRVVLLRTGMVLGPGGALRQILPPFRAGVGGRLGNGDQWMSWIHLQDAVRLISFPLDQPGVRGPVNVTAPNPVRNSEFTRLLGRLLRRPALFRVPEFGLRILFGEMASILLASQRVIPAAATRAGFEFKFAELGPALRDLLR